MNAAHIHPMIVHFPIVLLLSLAVFDLIAGFLGYNLAGGAVGVYFATAKKPTVSVVSASNWMLSYMPNQTYLYGVVSSDASQTITQDAERPVLEVLVSVGDTVQVGDPLLRYDATKDALDLEEKQLKLEKLQLELAAAYKEYERYARRPYATETPSPSNTPAPDAEAIGAKRLAAQGSGRVYFDLSAPTGGNGTHFDGGDTADSAPGGSAGVAGVRGSGGGPGTFDFENSTQYQGGFGGPGWIEFIWT